MLIIDVMMPEMDGFSLCAPIRRESDVPIIIVSAKDTEPDKIAGLTMESDDYLTKPFSPMELMARIKSIFRRMERGTVNEGSRCTVYIADITLNPDKKEARCNGRTIGFTGMEFSLLQYLSEHKERAIGRGELLDKVWGFEHEVETRATDDMMKRIRRKLSDVGSVLKIDTMWGFGYLLTRLSLWNSISPSAVILNVIFFCKWVNSYPM
ncbi:response regulator transcription factor [Paenibacillus macerans]|uniref:response regulator transcription factor n=1 Tax=Paenibacillus macerans TaxID=44252 RepID=UPI003D314184